MAEELRSRHKTRGVPPRLSRKQLKEITTCLFCRETFRDPRSLPCVHTFCLTCLSVSYNTNIPEEIPKCPLCGQYYSSPDGGPCELPKNIHLNQLMKMANITAMESQNLTELEALSSIESSGCYDVVTRKLPAFTTAVAKNFVKKLFIYIRLNNLASTKTLMQNINGTDREAVMRELSDDGSSPLFEAVRLGRLSFVEYFLDECNADIEQRCPWHQRKDMFTIEVTPLWLAAANNRLDIVKCLVNHGAQLNAHTTTWRSTVVRCACFSDHGESRIDLVRYLVENGADINIPNASESCCIHLATSSVELSRYLVQRGADINATDSKGWTALHYAVVNNHLNVVKELISLGADPLIQNENGVDVLQLAVMNYRDEIAAFLPSPTLMHDVNRSDISVLKGVRCARRRQYRDAVTYWRLAILQSDRENAVHRQRVLLYKRSNQSASNEFRLSDKMGQLLTVTEDNRDSIQQQVNLCEKLLGQCHPTTIDSLKYLAGVYADNGIYQWSVDTRINVLHRCRHVSVAYRPDYFFVDALLLLCYTSIDFHFKRGTVKFSDVAHAFKLTDEEFADTLLQPLFQIRWPRFLALMELSILLISIMLAVAKKPAEMIQLRELVATLVQRDPRAIDGRGLLHVAIEPPNNFLGTEYNSASPNDRVIETLLECGSAVTCTDHEGNTPIDYVMKSLLSSMDQTRRVVSLFMCYESMVPAGNR